MLDGQEDKAVKEVCGDIWNYHSLGHIVVITTNGTIKDNGRAVMGRGTAQQALRKFKELDLFLGHSLKQEGNHCFYFPAQRLITLPVKHNWWEKADVELIDRSLEELSVTVTPKVQGYERVFKPVVLTRPGCGNGGLEWYDVLPLMLGRIDERFIVVDRTK